MSIVLLTLFFLFASPNQISAAVPASVPSRILIAGTLTGSALPPDVVNGEILAPIGEDLTHLGARYSFDARTQVIRIESARRQMIQLKIGSDVLTRDGDAIKLATPPVLREGNVFLPVMPIAGALGAYARMEANGTLSISPQLTDVHLKSLEGETEVRIILTSPAKFKLGKLADPDRIYIDVESSVLDMEPGEFYHGDEEGDIVRGRVGQFSVSPDVCRVVFDLSEPFDFQVKSSPETREFILRIGPNVGKSGTDGSDSFVVPRSPAWNSIQWNSISLKGISIVVDAGHGGHDQGASGNKGTLEKHINLDIAKRLAARLSQLGARVIMTRSGDYFVTLSGRCAIANESGAHLFVSVHVNAWPTTNGRSGTEIFYTHPPSRDLAEAVHNRMITLLGRRDGGVRRRGLYVTNHTIMPAILTETAYVNHTEEERLLNTAEFRQMAADSIALGVSDYARVNLGEFIRPFKRGSLQPERRS